MNVYIYCIRYDYKHQSSITGHAFDNEWFKLEADGMVTIKGSNKKGYAWDGCSPKFKIWDIYFGTWEAVLNPETGQSKTYYASLVQDVLYQFNRQIKDPINRKDVDREFYKILKDNQFRLAKAYYIAVRLFGWVDWGRRA
jgi:hypothetical protein